MTDAHVDGNALGAYLFDLFGREMTDQRGRCGECGVAGLLGAIHVYRDAPGDVARCPTCHAVLFVVVLTPTGQRLTFRSLEWLEIVP
jgi:hypothetical protein